MRRLNFRSDDGSASLEFITVGMIMLVPLVYLVLAVSALQGATLAAEGAARHAVRAYVQAPNESEARAAANRALAVTLADYGLSQEASEIMVDCSDASSACLERGELVSIRVRVSVALPLVPDVLSLSERASVSLEASATQRVSNFWSEIP